MDEPHDRQWRTQYRDQRYMEHIPLKELNQRATDLVTNLTELTSDGTLVAIPVEGEGQEWWRKWTHVLEEFRLRNVPRSEDILAGVELPKPMVSPEYMALSRSGQRMLLKFGKRVHMEALFEQGSMRVAPASDYGDSSLNPAVHDDELSFESIALPGTTVRVSKSPSGPSVPVGGIKTCARNRPCLPTTTCTA